MCTTEPFTAVAQSLRNRVAAGHSAGMAFTFRDPDVSSDIRSSFPWARRLFVAASSYLPEAGTPDPGPGGGRIARFATRDHYRDLVAILDRVATALRADGRRAESIHDDNRLVDRAAAVRAGVGWWGKNTMVLTPGYGPWILLGSVATDAPLDPTEPMKRSCGTCAACLPACPTGALVAPGVLDARRCLAYVLQAPGEIPRDLRSAVGDRIYGCDDCIEACPPGSRLMEQSNARNGEVDLEALLALTDESLMDAHRHFYVPGRRARYLRRNALVALGNSAAGDGALPTLAGYVGHPDPLLRLHAAWALGRVGTKLARVVLASARADEPDEGVAREIALSLEEAAARRPPPAGGLR